MPTFVREEHVVHGVRTEVWVAGSGDPLVILHGVGWPLATEWALPLSEHHRVLLPVHPGFGGSDDDPSVRSLHDYVLHYLDLLDVLGLDRFHLLGHSIGAQLAAAFCVEHSHRVERLVLACPTGLEPPSADFFAMTPSELAASLTAEQAVRDRLAAPAPSVDFLVERYRESTSLARFAWAGLLDRRLRAWAHRITPSTLVLWGRDDRMVPAAQATSWAAVLPSAQVNVLDHRGHLLLEEGPEAVQVADRFLAGRPAELGAGS